MYVTNTWTFTRLNTKEKHVLASDGAGWCWCIVYSAGGIAGMHTAFSRKYEEENQQQQQHDHNGYLEGSARLLCWRRGRRIRLRGQGGEEGDIGLGHIQNREQIPEIGR